MLIVADSSALIALATCDGLDVLLSLYGDIRVPSAVFAEVTEPHKPEASVLRLFLEDCVVPVDTSRWVISAGGLGKGETEAIALYKELMADFLLIDDRHARLIAEHNRVHCIGALGVLLLAKKRGLFAEIAPYVEKLSVSAIHYSPLLLEKVLSLAKE